MVKKYLKCSARKHHQQLPSCIRPPSCFHNRFSGGVVVDYGNNRSIYKRSKRIGTLSEYYFGLTSSVDINKFNNIAQLCIREMLYLKLVQNNNNSEIMNKIYEEVYNNMTIESVESILSHYGGIDWDIIAQDCSVYPIFLSPHEARTLWVHSAASRKGLLPLGRSVGIKTSDALNEEKLIHLVRQQGTNNDTIDISKISDISNEIGHSLSDCLKYLFNKKIIIHNYSSKPKNTVKINHSSSSSNMKDIWDIIDNKIKLHVCMYGPVEWQCTSSLSTLAPSLLLRRWNYVLKNNTSCPRRFTRLENIKLLLLWGAIYSSTDGVYDDFNHIYTPREKDPIHKHFPGRCEESCRLRFAQMCSTYSRKLRVQAITDKDKDTHTHTHTHIKTDTLCGVLLY
eukprot:GHVR01067263.1.p1 GENE.GHVR01067263.1~~GHVR01067263.1.p1  ORF type:complete len:396 (+),score=93.99 GHVR01067263.1:17-1204(+)